MPRIIDQKLGEHTCSQTIETQGGLQTPKVEFKRTYYVLSDTLSDTWQDILATSGLPNIYDQSLGCRCNRVEPLEMTRIAKHPATGVPCTLWEVECNFDNTVDPSQNGGPSHEDPTQNRPKVRWYSVEEERVQEKDAVTGAPIETQCGEPLLLSTPVTLPILEIKRYELYPFDPDVILRYANTLNSTPFWGAPIGCAQMLPMETDEFILGESEYEIVTYRIKFKIQRDPVQEMVSAFRGISANLLKLMRGDIPTTIKINDSGNDIGGDVATIIGNSSYRDQANNIIAISFQQNPYYIKANADAFTLAYNQALAADSSLDINTFASTFKDFPIPKFQKYSFRENLRHEGYKFRVSPRDASDPAFRAAYPQLFQSNPNTGALIQPYTFKNGSVGKIVKSIDGNGNPVKVHLMNRGSTVTYTSVTGATGLTYTNLGGERFLPEEPGQPHYLPYNRLPFRNFNELVLGPGF